MKIAFYGDSLTEGFPGASYFRILKKRLPEHTLLNFGEGDDSAYSLYHRIIRRNLLQPVDLAFLWVGTNDVPLKTSSAAGMVKRLRGKPWAESPEIFQLQYRVLLDLIATAARRIVTVSPLLIGEELQSPFNRYLEVLSGIVRDISAHDPRTEFVDLRQTFITRLAGRPISQYLPGSVVRTLLDIITLRTHAQIDRVSRARGLHLTLDGIHLNSEGARCAADAFMRVIERYTPPPPRIRRR